MAQESPNPPEYQPMLFPDEAWSAWCDGDMSRLRLENHIRGIRVPQDAAPPGWPSHTQPVRPTGRVSGVGVAGILESERH